MPEIRNSFASIDDWNRFREEAGDLNRIAMTIVDDVETFGCHEPFSGIRRAPYEIRIDRHGLRESIGSHELNSRKRALLLQLMLELRIRGRLFDRRLKILAADGVTRAATILRGRFPMYLGTEYIPTAEDQEKFFPIPHVDLQEIPYADNAFDVFFSGDVFEHIPDLDKALAEIHRVLKPGGIIVSSFPFDPNREQTLVKAILKEDGDIEYLMEPEYHGNPVDPEGGALVFSLPGWDLLPKLRDMGFADAQFRYLASSHFGTAVEHIGGTLTLVAQKASEESETEMPSPPPFFCLRPLPKKMVTLVGLPRSGTTLLTSLFAVHSGVEAVYEPWNSSRLEGAADANLITLLDKEDVCDIGNRILFVKETAAKMAYIDCIKKLHKSLPFPVERHSLVILRRPDQTYLSEVARRKEWWGSDVKVSQQSFDDWCAKSKPAFAAILQLLSPPDSTLVALESLASNQKAVVGELADRIGIAVEPNQFSYQETLDQKRVRGDKNVSDSPQAVDPKLALSREDKRSQVEKYAKKSPHQDWFKAVASLHDVLLSKGGTMSGRELPHDLLQALQA